MTAANWHSLTAERVLTDLRSTMRGVSVDEAAERRRTGGTNDITIRVRTSSLGIFLRQFKSPLIGILAFAAVLSFAFEAVADGWIILAIVIFNGTIGYVQERKAGAAMERLRTLTPQLVHAVRDGTERVIPASDVIRGDVIVLEAGVIIPADGRIIESENVKLNEAVFTGESASVEKIADAIPAMTPVPERRNLIWRGTTVVGGRGRAVVTAIGDGTRFGQIVREVQHIPETATPFQNAVAAFAGRLAYVVIALCSAVFLLSILRGFPVQQSLLLSISLVVSLIPEGLPVVITLTFAWGMWQMAKRKALVRKLTAVETIGMVTVIASDKTGTLTFGEMMVAEMDADGRHLTVSGDGYGLHGGFFDHGSGVDAADHPVFRKLLLVGMINNDSRRTRYPDGREQWLGDPTEIALHVAAEKAGMNHDDLEREFPRVGAFPFDFRLKYMVTFHGQRDSRFFVAVKGAPQAILERCALRQTSNGIVPMTEEDRAAVRASYEDMASRALRGLCLASADIGEDWRTVQHETLGKGLVYLGLVGIRDPVRPGAKETIDEARRAGIRVMMLTGDYRVTANAVARELNVFTQRAAPQMLDGEELDRLSDDEARRRLATTNVCSRVSPEQKLRIARLLKASGDVVAMTGDGINDVPALAEANIGIAVGLASSDAAKETADMVLTDGNLSNIVTAIAEGRTLFRNIQRVLLYLLASNFGELLLILATMVMNLPLPLLPLHIIWLNMITDPFLGIALAREPRGPSVLLERPRSPETPILAAGHWSRIVVMGCTTAVAALTAFLIARHQQRPLAELYGLTLTTIAFAEWFAAFAVRSTRRSIHNGFWRNPWLFAALGVVVCLQVILLSVPTLADLFHVAAIRPADWILAIGLALLVVVGDEAWKRVVRRTSRSQVQA